MLHQKVGTNDHGDDLSPDAGAVVNEKLRCSNDEQNERTRQLQITVDDIGELGSEEEADHNSNEGNPQTHITPSGTVTVSK